MKSYVANLEKEIDLENEISKKIAGFSISKAEELIYSSAKKQLLKAQLMGAAIGFITGLLHILLNQQLFA